MPKAARPLPYWQLYTTAERWRQTSPAAQHIAGDGAFSLPMIADDTDSLTMRRRGV